MAPGRDSSASQPSLRPSPDVIAQSMGEVVVLVHLTTDGFYELNRTGARLWELLAAGNTPAQILQQMLQEFDIAPEQLAQEINALLAAMQERGLVIADG